MVFVNSLGKKKNRRGKILEITCKTYTSDKQYIGSRGIIGSTKLLVIKEVFIGWGGVYKVI